MKDLTGVQSERYPSCTSVCCFWKSKPLHVFLANQVSRWTDLSWFELDTFWKEFNEELIRGEKKKQHRHYLSLKNLASGLLCTAHNHKLPFNQICLQSNLLKSDSFLPAQLLGSKTICCLLYKGETDWIDVYVEEHKLDQKAGNKSWKQCFWRPQGSLFSPLRLRPQQHVVKNW